jgi:hypothetical protein
MPNILQVTNLIHVLVIYIFETNKFSRQNLQMTKRNYLPDKISVSFSNEWHEMYQIIHNVINCVEMWKIIF